MGHVNSRGTSFFAHGKLLLTGEYFVLDGAEAFCIPTQRGQHLVVAEHRMGDGLFWRSFTDQGECWFEARFDTDTFEATDANEPAVADTLTQILKAARAQNPEFLNITHGVLVETYLEFPRAWGWGSSSTLISMVAQWANINPYQLLKDTMGGSGYDLACAVAEGPITYQHTIEGPRITPTHWQPAFGEQLLFVWLNKKQNSRDAIACYRAAVAADSQLLHQVSQLTKAFIDAPDAATLENVISQHEQLTGSILQRTTVKEAYFADFAGAVKSLGAWGGDFVLAVSSQWSPAKIRAYFVNKGHETVLSLADI